MTRPSTRRTPMAASPAARAASALLLAGCSLLVISNAGCNAFGSGPACTTSSVRSNESFERCTGTCQFTGSNIQLVTTWSSGEHALRIGPGGSASRSFGGSGASLSGAALTMLVRCDAGTHVDVALGGNYVAVEGTGAWQPFSMNGAASVGGVCDGVSMIGAVLTAVGAGSCDIDNVSVSYSATTCDPGFCDGDAASPDAGFVWDIGGTTSPSEVGDDSTGAVPDPGTSGNACKTDADCDPLLLGSEICTATKPAYSLGSVDPHGMCISISPCKIADPTKLNACDKSNGVCIAEGSFNVCMPACAFDDSGAAATGCAATGNACNYHASALDSTGKLSGVGTCFGGCVADADCKVAGEKCDLLTELCTKSARVISPTKKLGTACTSADVASRACNCFDTGKSITLGVCTQACLVGDTVNPCPTGFVCDPLLPATMPSGAAGFTKLPKSMGGYCLATCVDDSTCVSGFHCATSGGMAAKTCQPK